jgi:ComF family protein
MISFRAILDIFFPKKCVLCGKNKHLLCPPCIQNLTRPFEQINPWTLSLFKYRDSSVKKIIWNIKYRGSHALCQDLVEKLYDELLEFLAEKLSVDESTQIILIPIPLTKKRLRSRGFNQTEILAKELEKQNKDLFKTESRVLIKIKETAPQAQIKNRERRLRNMRGVFTVKNSAAITGRTVLLIDDITTTGATLSEARNALKDSGAKQVFAITIGH